MRARRLFLNCRPDIEAPGGGMTCFLAPRMSPARTYVILCRSERFPSLAASRRPGSGTPPWAAGVPAAGDIEVTSLA